MCTIRLSRTFCGDSSRSREAYWRGVSVTGPCTLRTMSTQTIGILHPGAMGASVAASAKNSGCQVYWASEGRGSRTRGRAEAAGLIDAGSLADLCRSTKVIVSVCPPAAAEELADQVRGHGFRGTYVDANAIAPQRKQAMEQKMRDAGIAFIDGGIIGMPATQPGATWLCLSGPEAETVPEYFQQGPIGTEIVGTTVGQASALKMCFAAWTKGSTALLCSILASARSMDVLDDLKRHWARRGPDFSAVEREILRAAPKAWRFAPEMLEIAATLESQGMPPGFHLAAEQLYRRLESFKDSEPASVDDVLAGLS